MYVDESALTSEKLVPLNRSTNSLRLKISYEPLSFARWQMLLIVESTMRLQESMGMTESDLDDIRSTFTGTNPKLLAVAMLVSIIHMVFDVLAFKSDISFWKNTKSLAGISVRSLITSLISQIVILLYLYEGKASLLILVPSSASITIQVWKIARATGCQVTFTEVKQYGDKMTECWCFPRVRFQPQMSSSGNEVGG